MLYLYVYIHTSRIAQSTASMVCWHQASDAMRLLSADIDDFMQVCRISFFLLNQKGSFKNPLFYLKT